MVCSLFWVHLVMPRGVVDPLVSWSGKFNRHRTKVLWSMIPHCLMWVIWREMNLRTPEGNERLIHELKLFFFQSLFEWANASGVISFNSLPDMLDFCTFIVICTLRFLCIFLYQFSMKFITYQKKKMKFTI